MTRRETAHALLDQVPDERILEAEEAIKALASPLPFRALDELDTLELPAEPDDDEPAAVAEARADVVAGRTVSHEQVKREWGLG